jgi:hypothetical protein
VRCEERCAKGYEVAAATHEISCSLPVRRDARAASVMTLASKQSCSTMCDREHFQIGWPACTCLYNLSRSSLNSWRWSMVKVLVAVLSIEWALLLLARLDRLLLLLMRLRRQRDPSWEGLGFREGGFC